MQADIRPCHRVVQHPVGHGVHERAQLPGPDDVGVQDQVFALLHNLLHAGPGRRDPHQRDVHQPLHAAGRVAVPVNQLIQHVPGVLPVGDGRNPLVRLDAPRRVGDVFLRQIGVHCNVHQAVALVRRRGLAFSGGDGLVEHLHIQLIAHRLHVPVLAVPQKAARAADLEIPHGDAEPRPETGELPDGRKPLGRHLGQHLVPLEGEVGVGLAVGPPHPPADLVQLGQPHPVGILDDQSVAVAHVHAGLDQGGADQHVNLVVQQLLPHRGNLFLGHLAVGNADARPRHQLAHPGGALLDGLHPVVQVIDLPAPAQLPADRLGHNALVVFQHIGLDGLALKGRLLNGAHVPDARERHVQRAGNGGGAQGQHIHANEVFLELFLVLDAEPLLLVNDDQPQVAELHVVRQQPVGAHHNVHRAVLQPANRLLLFPGAAVTGQQPDADGERLHPGGGRVEMLPRQNGGGGQNGALLAAHDALEGGPQRHLGFAHAHVAAEQPVHRPGLFHVVLDLGGTGQLVGGLLIGKALLKIPLPGVVRREGIARRLLAPGVQLNQLFGHRLGGGLDLAPGPGPLAPAQTAQLDVVGIPRRCVAGQKVQLGNGNIEHILFVILDAQIILGHALHRHALDAGVPADAVVLVNHQIPGGDLGQAVQGVLCLFALLLAGGAALAKGPPRQNRIAGKGELAPGGQMPRQYLHQTRRGGRGGIGGHGQAFVPQIAAEPRRGALGTRQQRYGVAAVAQRFQIVQQGSHLAVPGGQRVGGGVDDVFQRLVRHTAGKIFGADRAVPPRPGPQIPRIGVQAVQPRAEHAVLQQAF